MGRAIALREDFDGAALRRFAKGSKDAGQSRRLVALAEIYDGGARTGAARLGDVGLQVIRDWVLRFNAKGANGLIDGKAPGKPRKLDDAQRQALSRIVEDGPIPAIDDVVRWRRKDLAFWIFEEFGISLEESSVGRELRALGFRKISARPRHEGQNEFAIEDFKENFPAELAKVRAVLPVDTDVEIWWQDEARVGQKTKLTRRWAKRGSRPTAAKDQRTKSAYIFGAICPARGVGAGLVLPRCNTQAMQWHLDEISCQVTPGAHAVIILDRAGWHTTGKLEIPPNITLVPLPPRAPELNPVENIWQFMRDNWLSNRIFNSYDDILAICCEAWNKLIDQPWKIMSIGRRKWAYGF
jgi:transposase